MTTFEGIAMPLAAALTARGFAALTPVQIAMCDPAIAGRDALVSAQTGSGKTVAFGLAMAPTLLGGADRFDAAGLPLALIVAPTRELAMQVKREFDWLFAETGAQIASCVGGMDYRTERRALDRGAHVVVGTPGRLRDHIERGSLDLSILRAVVLDEADEMLDLGFREDLEFILSAAPASRRTLMFSATVPRAIAELAQTYQTDALRIEAAGEARQHGDIDYVAVSVGPRDREHAIINLLRFYEAANSIVFAKTRAEVNHLMARLSNRGFAAVALSGELSQKDRSHALQAMRDGRARVCIATDVAARGIDLPGLELVIHADLPGSSETLLHRSGRTGRAGNKGVSALIVVPRDYRKANRLLQGAKVEARWGKAPSAAEVMEKDNERMYAAEALQDVVAEDEADAVAALVERFEPAQLAAAFLRQWRAGRSAPEELSEAPDQKPEQRPARDRAEFGPSVWFSLSVGREGRAEARWILPKLCDQGGITRTAIGAIRVQANETFIQIAAAAAPGFVAKLGAEMALEPGAVLTRLDGEPVLERPERREGGKPAPRPRTHDRDRGTTRFEPRERKPRHEKPAHPRPEKPAPRPEAKAPAGAAKDDAQPRKPRHGKAPGGKPAGKPAPDHKATGGGAKPTGKFTKPGRPAKFAAPATKKKTPERPFANAADPSQRLKPRKKPRKPS